MNPQEVDWNNETDLIKELSVIKELSDEEAGACVGGLYLDVELVDQVVNSVAPTTAKAEVGEIETGYDSNDSFRVRHKSRSDRNQKANFAKADVQEILGKVAALPITTWNYKNENANIRHIGPMAQDFATAFNVGEDNRFINTVDANGVALAAIQALSQKLQQKDAEIRTMSTQLDALRQEMLEIKQQTLSATPVTPLNCN
ncbi:MAG: tail fiber domain-containing protein [Coleofasciculus sp. B1-GNL1-01]|uniref:tail fiber domain-containing protein n=1 Tax=Coleofasciculus sp. B1-GNL1-01 TaxID=3068484 RepID=UPI00330200D9